MVLLEKEWFIQAPWGRICIIAWGDCFNPPVLLCHGAVDSAASFRPLIRHLPENFYYIGMELPGNGKSDYLPPGLMIHAYDLVYAIHVVVKHFRWDSFIYMAHSIGTLLGKIYNLSYPGKMTQVIDLDPTPAYNAIPPSEFSDWYRKFYTNYFKKYNKFNSPKDKGPIYMRDEAITQLKNNRGLTDETAVMVLDRLSEPVGDKNIRYIFDQRSKIITQPPFSPQLVQDLYTNIQTPTLTIVANLSVKLGFYSNTPFALDENAYPSKNYRVRRVRGNHDVHVIHPDRVAPFVVQFLLYGLNGLNAKAKL